MLPRQPQILSPEDANLFRWDMGWNRSPNTRAVTNPENLCLPGW
jgi:hypothetical protein